MTLKPSQILQILDQKRDSFSKFDIAAVKTLQQYRAALEEFVAMAEEERLDVLARPMGQLGARPLESFGKTVGGIFPAGLVWQNREESLEWVRDRLTGVTTFAVDGSQIYPGKDLSIPVALVQIGWFENAHRPDGRYLKDIRVDVMTPQDLQVGNSGEPVDRRVSMRRFEMECDRLVEYMQANPGAERCLLFFDGSLVATFARAFEASTRQFYIDCTLRLLRASERYRVPLIGYIDTSYADDVTVMLKTLFELPDANTIHDAQLFNRAMQWGDRTPLFLCDRLDILDSYAEHRDRITFTYLKTTHDNFPARLEIPLWVAESGRLEQILDWVRAEVIVGGGYPYAIETADQAAVLQTHDRQTFFRILQDWADQQQLNLRLSRKMVSKARRR
ncbi:MAG TPA: DNA double-strand break repair nuclease NurA [Synechococcales cyanobacterium M55_K2018_004]|nr:DNA double-strand break repair nuclease NurA [Synechococcales cyanobacterium M55_K2018_004]